MITCAVYNPIDSGVTGPAVVFTSDQDTLHPEQLIRVSPWIVTPSVEPAATD